MCDFLNYQLLTCKMSCFSLELFYSEQEDVGPQVPRYPSHPPSAHFPSTFLAQAEVFITFRLDIADCKRCMLSGILKLLFNVSLLNLLSISNKTLKIHYFSIPAKDFLMRLITREEERIFQKISLTTHLTFSTFKYHLLDLMLFEKCLWIFIVFQGCETKHTLNLPEINLPFFFLFFVLHA